MNVHDIGYTGYRRDDISGTYFAQAREYQPQNGRFTAEDVIKGNGAFPETLNRYGYCRGNPIMLVDNDGMEPTDILSILEIETERRNHTVYYLNNIEGASGFGHNAILLIDDEGNGKAYSYMDVIQNGNKLNHFRLTNGAIMGYAELTPDMVEGFLQDGSITFTKYKAGENFENRIPMINIDEYTGEVSPRKTTDDYDRALRKQITEEEYGILLDEMERIGREETTYSIYTYNCDTAVVTAISKIDKDFNGCYSGEILKDIKYGFLLGKKEWLMRNLTPNTSFNSIQDKVYGKPAFYGWQRVYLGDISMKEIIINKLQKFAIEPDEAIKEDIEDIYIFIRGMAREIECIE